MLHTGYIGFERDHTNWISKAMSWFMGSEWSHTFLVLGQARTVRMLCETTEFEVTYTDLDRYLTDENKTIEIFKVELTDEQKNALTTATKSIVGTVYGYLQLLSFAVQITLSKVGIRVPNFIRQGMVCTAVPLYAYNIAKIPHFSDIDPESIHTETLYQIVKSRGYEVVLRKEKGEVFTLDGEIL